MCMMKSFKITMPNGNKGIIIINGYYFYMHEIIHLGSMVTLYLAAFLEFGSFTVPGRVIPASNPSPVHWREAYHNGRGYLYV